MEGAGIVDINTGKVLLCVSRGTLSHEEVHSKLAQGDADNSQILSGSSLRVTVVVSDEIGLEVDWESSIQPYLNQCCHVVKAACNTNKPSPGKMEKNYTALYLGFMRVIVLGLEGVSTSLAVRNRPKSRSNKDLLNQNRVLSQLPLESPRNPKLDFNKNKHLLNLILPEESFGVGEDSKLTEVEAEEPLVVNQFGSSFLATDIGDVFDNNNNSSNLQSEDSDLQSKRRRSSIEQIHANFAKLPAETMAALSIADGVTDVGRELAGSLSLDGEEEEFSELGQRFPPPDEKEDTEEEEEKEDTEEEEEEEEEEPGHVGRKLPTPPVMTAEEDAVPYADLNTPGNHLSVVVPPPPTSEPDSEEEYGILASPNGPPPPHTSSEEEEPEDVSASPSGPPPSSTDANFGESSGPTSPSGPPPPPNEDFDDSLEENRRLQDTIKEQGGKGSIATPSVGHSDEEVDELVPKSPPYSPAEDDGNNPFATSGSEEEEETNRFVAAQREGIIPPPSPSSDGARDSSSDIEETGAFVIPPPSSFSDEDEDVIPPPMEGPDEDEDVIPPPMEGPDEELPAINKDRDIEDLLIVPQPPTDDPMDDDDDIEDDTEIPPPVEEPTSDGDDIEDDTEIPPPVEEPTSDGDDIEEFSKGEKAIPAGNAPPNHEMEVPPPMHNPPEDDEDNLANSSLPDDDDYIEPPPSPPPGALPSENIDRSENELRIAPTSGEPILPPPDEEPPSSVMEASSLLSSDSASIPVPPPDSPPPPPDSPPALVVVQEGSEDDVSPPSSPPPPSSSQQADDSEIAFKPPSSPPPHYFKQ